MVVGRFQKELGCDIAGQMRRSGCQCGQGGVGYVLGARRRVGGERDVCVYCLGLG